jgi:CoA:oxalate CoA-transferase
VSKLNPKIVMCSVSTFGQTGPLASNPGYDFIGQAYAGVTSLSGEEDGGYYPPALAMGDVSAGVHAYAAVATALVRRERTGEGQHLDISLLDSYFHYHDLAVELISASHGEARVKRMGNQIGALCPAGIFKAATGYLWIFAFQENHWAKLREIMGREETPRSPTLCGQYITRCESCRSEQGDRRVASNVYRYRCGNRSFAGSVDSACTRVDS